MDASRRGEAARPTAFGVPLLAFAGSARECGREYAESVLRLYPGYRRYLDPACRWRAELSGAARRLLAVRAPQIDEVFAGMADVAGPGGAAPRDDGGGCTSFGVAGSVTLDGQPLSGQTKDTVRASAALYVVLRLRLKDAPTILVLAYPGEVLGYGLWSTGMSIFRNSLHSSAEADQGLTMEQWGVLALASDSVDEAVELGMEHGIRGAGCCLVSDARGGSVAVEFNVGGVGAVRAENGVVVHANHPEAAATARFEHYPDTAERDGSRRRGARLQKLLEQARGRLTAPEALRLLADHADAPPGICRHDIAGGRDIMTTAAVVAEPTRGRLHVTRGNPCCNLPQTYTV